MIARWGKNSIENDFEKVLDHKGRGVEGGEGDGSKMHGVRIFRYSFH